MVTDIENSQPDRRRWCTTARGLSLIVGDLRDRGIMSSNVHTLAERLRTQGIYPARDFAGRCLERAPDLFVTYDWQENYVDLQEAVWSGLDLIGSIVRERRPDLDEVDVERLIADRIGIWVDFLFIDQSARDVVGELAVLPALIEGSDAHFVLSRTALTRAWCCYELALFNKRDPTEPSGGRTLRSFVTPTLASNYTGFASTSSTAPRDKVEIERNIEADYPGGMIGLDGLLMQVSLQSDPFFTRGAAQAVAAHELVADAIDRWLQHQLGPS